MGLSLSFLLRPIANYVVLTYCSALLYWQFAIFTILEPIRERSGRRRLDFFLSRARNNVLYVTKYEQQLTKGTVDAVDKV